MIVLESTSQVMRRARHVSIDAAAVAAWANNARAESFDWSNSDAWTALPGERSKLANFVLMTDALNFCFWSDRPIRTTWNGRSYHRYEAMLYALIAAARDDARWFDARFWRDLDRSTLEKALAVEGDLLMIDERAAVARETAQTLIDRFDGQFSIAADSVNGQAWPLAVLLMTNFDSFRDVATHDGQPVFFLKRAQICALNLSQAWSAHQAGLIEGLETLTAFADYRVPQALQHLGILRVHPDLGARIDAREELPPGSTEEVEIRAATVQAVEAMRAALVAAGRACPAWRIDCHLWRLGRSPEVRVEHHRTRTVYY